MSDQNHRETPFLGPVPPSGSGGDARGAPNWHGHHATHGYGADSTARSIVARARTRLQIVSGGFALLFLVIIAQLVHVTVFTGDAVTPAETRPAAATVRADITDRNGELLATSLAVTSVYADAARVIEPAITAEKIRRVFPSLNAQTLLADLKSGKRFVWLARSITPQQHKALHDLGLPGIEFKDEMRRIYPHGQLFAHALGYVNIDGTGIAGLEQGINETLTTSDEAVTLSLDVRLQHIMRRELQAAMRKFSAIGAGGMIMDVMDGEILAFVSLPDFDPQNPGGAVDDARFNRLTLGTYEMGSTFKIFNTALALESGLVKISDTFDCTKPVTFGRFKITDFHPENRWLTVPEIMLHSSNIGSVRILQKVGFAEQKPFLAKLGLTEKAPLELPERGAPLLPDPWRDINAMTISFGHGMAVSPLHLVRATAAAVNGGTLLAPTLIRHPDDEVIVGEKVISRRTSEHLRRMMRMVVSEGTAQKAEAPGYEVGGKTGTAEKLSGKRYNANARLSSFIGAFPMRDPRYVIFVMLDEPKGIKETFGFATGGWVAAPVVSSIVTQMAPILGIPPVVVEKTKAANNKAAPESDFTELQEDN